MEGNRAEESGKRPADAERVGRSSSSLAPHPERLERQGHERGRGARGVAFEGREIDRRRLLEVLLARLDEAVEVRAREALALDEVGKWQRHRMAPRLARIDCLDRLAPPLEANASQQRLARHFARLRHLQIEGIEREKPLAPLARGKERRQEAVGIITPHLGGTVGELTLGHAATWREGSDYSTGPRPGAASRGSAPA